MWKQVPHKSGGTPVSASGVPGGGFNPPLPKFRRPLKSCQTQPDYENLKIAEFRTPTPQDVRKKGSKILKLPSVRNCFTLAMTNKLVSVINSLKVPKINNILLYEMKFLVPNYSCLLNTWPGATAPGSPFPLSSVRNWISWIPPSPSNKIPWYATALSQRLIHSQILKFYSCRLTFPH